MREEQDAWVARVLGVPPRARPGPARDARQLMGIWNGAKETVDEQIGKLQVAFREVEHPLGKAVADRGLTALTGRLVVGLQVALRNYAAVPDVGRDATALLGAIDGLMALLASEPVLSLLEENPFGVPVTIRTTLGTALHAMRDALPH